MMSDLNGGGQDFDADHSSSMTRLIDETTSGRDFLAVFDAVLKLVEDPAYSSDSRFVPLPALINNLQSFLGDMLNHPRHYGFDGGPLETNWKWVARWLAMSTRAAREGASPEAESSELAKILGEFERVDENRKLVSLVKELAGATRRDATLDAMTQVPLLKQMRDHLENALNGRSAGSLPQPDENGMDWMWLAEWIHNAALKN